MEGVYTAIITPFDAKGELDLAAFAEICKDQELAKIDGLVIGGTTGEGWSLSNDEIETLYVVAKENFSKVIVIGTGDMSTNITIQKTYFAKNLGADAALIVVPYYNLPSEKGVVDHYKQAAEVGLPIIVYHHPKRTGVRLSIGALEEICDIEGVVAIKETVDDMEYYKHLSKKIPLFSGNDGEMKKCKEFGAKGVISVISNVCPLETKQFFASNEGDSSWNKKKLVAELFKEGNPAGIKGALKNKYRFGDFVRSPLLSLSKKGLRSMNTIFNEAFR